MPTPFAHVWAAVAISPFFTNKSNVTKLLFLGALCSIIPDADVIAFDFGIPYEHLFGHRGFTHSISFSVLFSLFILFLFYRDSFTNRKIWLSLFIYFFLCTVSHSLFDAMTNGGKKVAPLSLDGLMSDWGRKVLISEFKVVWLPCIFFWLVVLGLKRKS